MSLAPIHSLRSRFTPVEHHQPRHAPVERVERSVDLSGAPPEQTVVFRTAAANALSGPDAAGNDLAPPVPLLAPGARFDAWA
jgi:hypothetical protein